MKPDYKNWMPKGMVLSSVVTMLFLILFIIFGLSGIVSGTIKTVLFFVFLAATVFGIGISLWMILMYRTFSYDGERQMSRQIIEGIADYVKLPEGGNGLDHDVYGHQKLPDYEDGRTAGTMDAKRRES